MNLFSKDMKTGNLLLAVSFLSLIFVMHPANVKADETVSINPRFDFGGIIPLTPGSSTTVNVKTSGDMKLDLGHIFNMNVTVVMCLGEGTLTIGLTKGDTKNDLVSMFIFGYHAKPFFIPNFGITPATISVSTVIDNSLGGFGMVFILSGVNSDAKPPHEYTQSLKLIP